MARDRRSRSRSTAAPTACAGGSSDARRRAPAAVRRRCPRPCSRAAASPPSKTLLSSGVSSSVATRAPISSSRAKCSSPRRVVICQQLVDLSQRFPGAARVDRTFAIVVDVLPERDEEAVALVRPRIDDSRGAGDLGARAARNAVSSSSCSIQARSRRRVNVIGTRATTGSGARCTRTFVRSRNRRGSRTSSPTSRATATAASTASLTR